MTCLSVKYRNGTIAPCLLVLLVLILMTGGCTQPVSRPQQEVPAPVIVSQSDTSNMKITYSGSTDTRTLLELEVTVTDSGGKTQTRSIGDRHSTTPLRFGATLPLTGTFSGNDHVLVTGYFMDSSKKILLDTSV